MKLTLCVLFAVLSLLACAVDGQTPAFLQAFPGASIQELGNFTDAQMEEFLNENKPIAEAVPMTAACPSIPIPADTNSVHQLKPGHIKVVMAMGDSISAAMSAKDSSLINLNEWRGISFSIGGDAGVNTMPNLLKQFTAPGYPIGPSIGTGSRTSAGTGLNGAVSGAINVDMLSQAQWLAASLRANTKINFTADWKVLTIWIGSNNLCDVCDEPADNNADDFERHVTAALDYLYTNVPRLFVNLLQNLDVSILNEVKDGTCGALHVVECNCIATTPAKRSSVQAAVKDYWARVDKIAANFAARNNQQFAVVSQPFLMQSEIYNRSYLSAADCFHPSAVAHSAAATALWNSMITPRAQKKLSWDPATPALCATESSLLYTN